MWSASSFAFTAMQHFVMQRPRDRPTAAMAGACLAVLLLLAGARPTSTAVADGLLEKATELFPWMRTIRRSLHATPELGFELPETSKYIQRKLTELGIPHTLAAATGVVGRLGAGAPTFALRADMDALPIQEEVHVEFRSRTAGRMHACGHDAHMTMLLGGMTSSRMAALAKRYVAAARLLKQREAALRGTVLLVFQPAEEGGAGGKRMVDEGVLRGVAGVHGLHVWPGLPAGTIASRDGTILAAADMFSATVRGAGGHGAMPHLGRDPVVAAAHIVTALQALVSRETSPTSSAVVTVARFNTGEGASNVIPDNVRLSGTLRALTLDEFGRLRERVSQVVASVAGALECEADIEWLAQPYGPTVNAPREVARVEAAARRLVAGAWERLAEPSMGGEDFSFMADAIPGAFTFLGIRNETAGSTSGLHTPTFQMDEWQMPLGAALHASVALAALEDHVQDGNLHEEL